MRARAHAEPACVGRAYEPHRVEVGLDERSYHGLESLSGRRRLELREAEADEQRGRTVDDDRLPLSTIVFLALHHEPLGTREADHAG